MSDPPSLAGSGKRSSASATLSAAPGPPESSAAMEHAATNYQRRSMGNIRCNSWEIYRSKSLRFFQDYPLEYYTTTVADIKEELWNPAVEDWDSEDYDDSALVEPLDDHDNVSTTNNVEQKESSLAGNQTEAGADELQDFLPLPTLLTDSDFSNNPFLEEQVGETTQAISENKAMKEGGEKGDDEERTTRKSFSLQGIRVTVREGGGRRWKQGSQIKSIHLSDLKKKPAQVPLELDNSPDRNVEEKMGEKENFEDKKLEMAGGLTAEKEDPSLIIDDNSTNNLMDLVSILPVSNGKVDENIGSEVNGDFEEEAAEVKLNRSSSSSGGIGGAGLGDSDKGQAGSGATLLPSLMGGRQGGREERGEGDNGHGDAGKEVESGLQHFLRIGATMEEGLSLLAEEHTTDAAFQDSKVLVGNIVKTSYSSASEKIHHWLLRPPVLCLLFLLITF